MGVEIPEQYGGTGSSFFVANLVVEEIAKVDMSVSVMVDIQNTLNNMLILRLGTPEQQEKYLPRLATDTVSTITMVHVLCCSFIEMQSQISLNELC